MTSQILLVAKKELHEREVRQHSPYHNEIQQLESQIAPLQRKLDELKSLEDQYVSRVVKV